MNHSRDFSRMPSQYAVDHPTFPVNQRYFHLIVIQWDAKPSWEIAEPQQSAARYLEFAWYIGKRFCKSTSWSLYPGEFNPWISRVTEDTLVLTSTGRPVACGERQNPDTVLNPRCQTGPSAGNSFDPKEGRFSNSYGADQQRLQISELHFDKFPYTSHVCFLEDKIQKLRNALVHNFIRKQWIGSKKRRWLNQWMIWILRVLSKELMVQTLSCSTREVLQHWTKSSRIPVPASRKRSVWRKWKLTEKTASSDEDSLLSWSTNSSGSLGPTILSIIMPDLQLFFEMMIIRNSIRNGTEFYSQWHKSHLMTSWKFCP